MKQFLTLEYDPDYPLEWRIVLAEQISTTTARRLHPMDGLVQDAFNTIPDNFCWLAHLVTFLRAEPEMGVDLSHIFGDYNEDEFAEAIKKSMEKS